jgi:hypothetical protein
MLSALMRRQARSNNSLEAFHQYITYERRARHPDKVILQGVSERAIAEAAQRRSRNEPGAPEALATFWIDYLDDLVGPTCYIYARN